MIDTGLGHVACFGRADGGMERERKGNDRGLGEEEEGCLRSRVVWAGVSLPPLSDCDSEGASANLNFQSRESREAI